MAIVACAGMVLGIGRVRMQPLALLGLALACAAPTAPVEDRPDTRAGTNPPPDEVPRPPSRGPTLRVNASPDQPQPDPAQQTRELGARLREAMCALACANNACGSDRACSVARTRCPTECGVAVRRDAVSRVEQKHDVLLQRYPEHVKAECLTKCPRLTAVCVEGRCAARKEGLPGTSVERTNCD